MFLSLILVLGCVYGTPAYSEAKNNKTQMTDSNSSSKTVSDNSNNRNVVPGQEKKQKQNPDTPSNPEEYQVSFDVVAGLETAGVFSSGFFHTPCHQKKS